MVKDRLELLKLDRYIGIYNPKTRQRLKNLCPKKSATIKARASAYEGGFAYYESYDLHKKLRKRKTISPKEYKKLLKIYKC